jgi:hypothetical protein
VDLARRYAQEICIAGGLAVTPHLLSQHFDGIRDYMWWCEAMLVLMRRCDALYMLPRYERSNGSMAELTEALRLEIPVFYHLTELKEWLNAQP